MYVAENGIKALDFSSIQISKKKLKFWPKIYNIFGSLFWWCDDKSA